MEVGGFGVGGVEPRIWLEKDMELNCRRGGRVVSYQPSSAEVTVQRHSKLSSIPFLIHFFMLPEIK